MTDEELELFPTSESALKMLSYVTPGFYDKSYVGKWMFQVMGLEYDKALKLAEELPEQFNMSLSDAYEKKSQDISLELKVKVLNVNRGYNDSLMKKSPTLYQYMMFVDTVRRFQKEYPFEQAMEQAIDECIRTGILSDFLRKSRAEVMRMWLFEYDQEKHIEMEKEESYEDGKREYLITLVVKLKNKGKTVDEIADILEEPVEKIQKICEISENYAPDYDAQKIYQELENSEY